jgi:hypothetical protein
MFDERAPDSLAMNGRLDPDVLEIPPIAAILERTHPDDPAIAIRDPDVVHLEISGQDRELRVPLAHPRRRIPPVRLRAVREICQGVRIVSGGQPNETPGIAQWRHGRPLPTKMPPSREVFKREIRRGRMA